MLLGNKFILEDTGNLPGFRRALAFDDGDNGFFGETTVDQLIDGIELASLCGLTAGIPFNDQSPWLKFKHQGKWLWIAKNPYRHSLKWNDLKALSLVKGDRILTIGGRSYKIRLIRGADIDPAKATHNSSNPSGTRNSEWSVLLGRVVSQFTYVGAPSKWWDYDQTEVTAQGGAGNYGTSNLCLENSAWGQSNSAASNYIVLRGYTGVNNYYVTLNTNASGFSGWRPVLEFIE